MRVAVVGGGVAGLTAARTLARVGAEVTLYEKEKYVGGHGHSLNLSNVGAQLDAFQSEVGVEVESCAMSFGVRITGNKTYEWSSAGFARLFAYKRNILDPYFWNLIREFFKFSRAVRRFLQKVESNDTSVNPEETLGQFLASHAFSKKFKEDYLLMEELRDAGTKIKKNTNVTQIKVLERDSVQLEDDKGGLDIFDACIVAANAQDALRMRGEDATLSEKRVLGSVKYLDW